jgi:hypothetical protein
MKTKKKAASSGKSAAAIAEYNKRLGLVRRVVSMTRAKGTKAAYNLRLECKHTRVGTKQATVRCGRCKGAK